MKYQLLAQFNGGVSVAIAFAGTASTEHTNSLESGPHTLPFHA